VSGYFSDSIVFADNTTLYSDNLYNDCFIATFDPDNGDFLSATDIDAIESVQGLNVFNSFAGSDYNIYSGVYVDSIRLMTDTITLFNNTQDIHVFKADHLGNLLWHSEVKGRGQEYSYSSTYDDEGNIYVSGYFLSDTLTIVTNDIEEVVIQKNFGATDIFIIKFSNDGEYIWARSAGSSNSDYTYDIDFFDNDLQLAGSFSDTLHWGGIELISSSSADRDMFVGSIDKDGNFRNANSSSGRNNSTEEARAIFGNGNDLYTIILSNSDQLVLGDSIYTSADNSYYITLGVIGCLPISVDNTIYNDVETCFGDSTGSIQILATGGFGSPWTYSIDNGFTSLASPFFADLPAGDYQVVVVDQEGCAQTGPLITLTEPDTLLPSVSLKTDIEHLTYWSGAVEITDGTLAITASGGTPPNTYQLLPGGSPQAIGSYSFALEDSGRYVVALNDINGCGSSETDSVDINVNRTKNYVDGIEGFEGVEVKMYPNPTSGILTLELPFDKAECPMELLNMNGQIVMRKQIYPSSGMINETLDLSKVPKGLYLLRLDGRSLKSAIVVK